MSKKFNDPKGAAGAVKVPLGLVPPYAMEQTAWVHKLGAEKYGRKVPVYACSKGEELAEFCTCGYSTLNLHATLKDPTQPKGYVLSAITKNTQEANSPFVTQGELLGQGDCVNHATINFLEKLIQNIKKDSKKHHLLGLKLIKNTSKKKHQNVGNDPTSDEETQSGIESGLSLLSGLLLTMKSQYLKNKTMGVGFAVGQPEEGGFLTSTTTTKLGSSEDSFVTDVIKDLACSETISNLLKKHSPTCNVNSLIVRDGEVEQYGAFNWRRTGVCASTYIHAILRHLNAWRDGEDLDPESGISHLAHVACSANILMDAGYCGKLQDDRNKSSDVSEDELLSASFDEFMAHVKSTKSDKVEEGYRILEKGEILKDGDEVYVGFSDWMTLYIPHWIEQEVVGGTYRRKLITNCDLKETCDSKPESQEECECGRRYVYHFMYGWICEDCELYSDKKDYYP